MVLAAVGAGAACVLTAAMGTSRVAALALGYGAPSRAFSRGLPVHPVRSVDDANDENDENDESDASFVCVGDEWHRFPSSFFFPSDAYR